MKRILFTLLIVGLLFYGIWYALTNINWSKIFHLQQLSDKTEEKLGDLIWDTYSRAETENKNMLIHQGIDSLVGQLCKANKIDRKKIKLHVLNNNEINAFALPNGHLVVYTGLLGFCDNQEQLLGVVGHELAHIQLKHIMKKLVREVGLSVLISLTTGQGESEKLKEVMKRISSTAFDRSLEKEADIKAVHYLIQAGVNPVPFSDFLLKLSQNENVTDQYMTWISTHPASQERADYILQHGKNKLNEYRSILSLQTWEQMKASLKN